MALRSRLLQTAILLAAGTITVSSFGVNSPIQSQTISAFVRSASPSVSSSPSKLNMMEECPEIPFTAQLDPKYDTCIIALGCFWHPQLEYQQMEGVERVVVGYTGGEQLNPTYQNIKDSTEAVLIEYDPSKVSYEELLIEWSKQHYPFNPPFKTQYKSAIWVKSEEERTIALNLLKKMSEEKDGKEVYVDVEDAKPFYRAEEYHQDFLNKQKSSRSFMPY